MSSANNPVGAITAYLTQGTAAQAVSTVNNLKANVKATGKNFENVLGKVKDNLSTAKSESTSKDVNQKTDEVKTPVKDTTENTVKIVKDADTTQDNAKNTDIEEKPEVVDVTETKTEETQNAEASEELQEAINEGGNAIIIQVADKFDLSEDEMINAMQVLGLVVADMINPETIIPLVTETSGIEDVTDLITDSDIYTSLQDLMEGAESMRSELMNEFGLSEEELQVAVDETRQSFTTVMQQVNSDEEVPQMPEENVKAETGKEFIIGKNQDTTKAPQSEVFSDQPEKEEKVIQITTENMNESGRENNKGNLHQGAESANLFNQIVNNITEAVPEATGFEHFAYTNRAQMENIIHQITDRITIMASAEETSMELQLHPASLGNVNVLLSSGKDGITAKFTAQNELVKEAVESQMVQLQQKFEEQGIKVTSIEITIASHAFEQNLEQGNEDRDPSDAQKGTKARGLRRLNLSEIDETESESEMSDAEKIAVQMMAMNGNTVDFSA